MLSLWSQYSFYLLYKMNSAAWTSFCDCMRKSHDNLIQCSDCHAWNSQISHSVSSSISVQRDIVDLSIDFFLLLLLLLLPVCKQQYRSLPSRNLQTIIVSVVQRHFDRLISPSVLPLYEQNDVKLQSLSIQHHIVQLSHSLCFSMILWVICLRQ